MDCFGHHETGFQHLNVFGTHHMQLLSQHHNQNLNLFHIQLQIQIQAANQEIQLPILRL